jgi:hypothetical protein
LISPATTSKNFRLLALAALGLYALLPFAAAGLSSAEPSFAGEIFSWLKNLSPDTLAALHNSGSHIRASVCFATICAALFGIYFFALKLAQENNDVSSQKIIFLGGAAFLLVQIFAPVMLSSDVFAYALYGRVSSVYYANPYDLAPPVAADDPFLKLFGQEYLPSWYGPVWTLATTLITRLTGEHIGLTVLAFRLTGILAALACAWLILASLRRHAPERTTQGLVFFLWNPLVIIETGMSGHNDSVMLVFVLLAVWLHLRGWKTAAVVALTLSALVKFLTGMLIPLYVLLVLREMSRSAGLRPAVIPPATEAGGNSYDLSAGKAAAGHRPALRNLRQKLFFLVRCAVAIALVCIAANVLTKSNSTASAPVSHQAIAPDFYANNFHELVFKGLRRALGEDADSVRNPIYFQGWWLAATNRDWLLAPPEVSPDGLAVALLAAGSRVVVIAPQTDNDWAHVYDPVSKQRGFVWFPAFADSERPANADELSKFFDTMTAERPTVVLANNFLRAVLWLAFAAFGLLCAWRTNSFAEFPVWSAAALLASYFLIITEIWPWYANWAVAVGALATNRAPAKLAAILSACVLTLYITFGFQGSDQNWIYTFRSLPAFVLPLLIWFVLNFRRAKPHATR